MTSTTNEIFNQINVYVTQNKFLELSLKENSYLAGTRDDVIRNMKKNNGMIDVLLDKYNREKTLSQLSV